MIYSLRITEENASYIAERCSEPVDKIERFMNQHIIVQSYVTGLHPICYVDDVFYDDHYKPGNVYNGSFRELVDL